MTQPLACPSIAVVQGEGYAALGELQDAYPAARSDLEVRWGGMADAVLPCCTLPPLAPGATRPPRHPSPVPPGPCCRRLLQEGLLSSRPAFYPSQHARSYLGPPHLLTLPPRPFSPAVNRRSRRRACCSACRRGTRSGRRCSTRWTHACSSRWMQTCRCAPSGRDKDRWDGLLFDKIEKNLRQEQKTHGVWGRLEWVQPCRCRYHRRWRGVGAL